MKQNYPSVILKPNRERIIEAGHPWIFSNALQNSPEIISPVVEVISAKGNSLGLAFYSPKSQIRCRMLTKEKTNLDENFWKHRLQNSLNLRAPLINNTDAFRLINAEGDNLPGLIVDKYNDYLIIQIMCAGLIAFKKTIIDILASISGVQGILESSQGRGLRKEGLPDKQELLYGKVPEEIIIKENGVKYKVDVWQGQKTGFYLDQRDNRQLVGQRSKEKKILDLFCYTGGFSVKAIKSGAREVLGVDNSRPALDIYTQNMQMNNINKGFTTIKENVFDFLSALNPTDNFQLIILDPPALAKSSADRQSALRAYRWLLHRSLQHLTDEGELFIFSCSYHLSLLDLCEVVAAAASGENCSLQILKILGPGIDHPHKFIHKEADYLNGLWLRKA